MFTKESIKKFRLFFFFLGTLLITPIIGFSQSDEYEEFSIYVKTLDTSMVHLTYTPNQLIPPSSGINLVFYNFGVAEITQPFAITGGLRVGHIYQIQFSTGTAEEFINSLTSFNFIEYAERVAIPKIFSTTPVDDEYPAYLSLINAYQAFDISNGNATTYRPTVAIVDDAVLTTHEDLEDNIIQGFDVADGDNDPNPPISGNNHVTPYYFSHGTAVAGIAGAVTNNQIGVASVSWNCNILPIKCSKDVGDPTKVPFGYAGISKSAANGAEIINLSWGNFAPQKAHYDVIKDAYDMGVVIVAASGNNNSGTPSFPASYGEGFVYQLTGETYEQVNSNLVISVAAIDNNGDRSNNWAGGGSQYGSGVDICAYGTGVLCTVGNSNNGSPIINEYAAYSGTSMAAPQVAGLLSLMKAYKPNLPMSEHVQCLLKSANPDIYNTTLHPNNIPGSLGSGRIDAFRALACLSGCDFPIATITPSSFHICPNGTVNLSATQGISYQWSNNATTNTLQINTPGTYTVTVTLFGGCTASTSITLESTPTNPQLNFSESSGLGINDGNVCFGDYYNLGAAYGSGYTWSVDGNPAPGWDGLALLENLNHPYINPPYSKIYAVTITDLYGCPGLTGTATATVNTYPNPNGSILITENSGNPNDALICESSGAVLLEAAGGDSYSWNTNATTSTISVTPASTTTYTVTISDVNRCFVEVNQTVTVSSCTPYVSCALCSGANSINITASPNGTLYSTLGLSYPILEASCISISGKLIIDVNLEIKCYEIRMNAGSEIIVGNLSSTIPFATLKIDNFIMSGCEQMWKGIKVLPNSALIVNNGVIKDAEYAITAIPSQPSIYPPTTKLSVTNIGFNQNHVGIYIPKIIGIGSVSTYPMNGNSFATFLQSTPLLPPTDANLKYYDNKYGLAGIISEQNGSSLIIGGPGSSGYSNYFWRLRNGIISSDNWLTVERCNFEDMVGHTSSQGVISLGSGYPKGVSIFSNQGITSTLNSKFYFVGHGVYSNKSIVGVNKNDFTVMNIGVQMNSPISFSINDDAYDFQKINSFLEYGIIARELSPSKILSLKYQIKKNKIYNNEKDQNAENYSAIYISNSVDPVLPVGLGKISNNESTTGFGIDGINMSNQSNWGINDNEILHNTAASGILINNCNDLYLLGNATDGGLPSPSDPSMSLASSDGISIQNSNNIELCCNMSSNVFVGINFWGPCENTILKTMTMTKAYYDIQCSSSTMLSDQPNQTDSPDLSFGNAFDKLLTGQNFGMANHNGSDIFIQDSEFFVKDNTAPDFPEIISTPNSSSDWFDYNESYDELDCGDCESPQGAQEGRDHKVTEVDLHVLEGLYQNENFAPMIDWEVKTSLLRKISISPQLIGQFSLVDSFYSNIENKTIGKYHLANEQIRNIYEIPTQLKNEIEIKYLSFDTIKNYVESEKNKIIFASNLRDSLSNYQIVDSLLNIANIKFTDFFESLEKADSIKYINVDIALVANSQLPVEDIIQSNNKTFNQIYLETIGKDIYSLTDSQFLKISYIANQCPLIGGKIVYNARSLCELKDSISLSFSDAILCDEDNERENNINYKNNNSNNNLIVFPNPAVDKLQCISQEFANIKNIQINIYDISGKLQKSQRCNVKGTLIEPDIAGLPNGLFICTINTGQKTQTFKFVINK